MMPSVFGPLIEAWLSNERGEPTPAPRQHPPPHVQDQHWSFVCECGAWWKAKADAVWREGQWRAPAQPCVVCPAWVTGRHLEK